MKNDWAISFTVDWLEQKLGAFFNQSIFHQISYLQLKLKRFMGYFFFENKWNQKMQLQK
jgi:hypothetical protein